MNEQYPLKERLYGALSEISQVDEVTDEVVLAAVRNWTTDNLEDNVLGEDSLELSSYIVSHIHTQMTVEKHFEAARIFRDRLNQSEIDTEKLIRQDPKEAEKLMKLLLTIREEAQDDYHDQLPEDFNLDDILSAVDDEHAPHEESTEVRVRETLVNRVDTQTRIGALLYSYLSATINNDQSTSHAISDSAGCTLLHAMTSLMLSYIQSRQRLPEDVSIEEWVESLLTKSKEIFEMSDDDKVELAQHMMEMGENDDE